MTTFLIILLVLLLIGGAGAAGYFLLRGPKTDTPPRPEGLTPEMRKLLEKIGRRSDLGREIAGDMAEVNGDTLWPAYRDKITDRAVRRSLEEGRNSCRTLRTPLRKVYCPGEYREEVAALPTNKGEYRPFHPLSIHSTIKTLYIRFCLEDNNRQLLEPPVYRPVILTMEQQAAYLEKVRPVMSQAAWLQKQVAEASDEPFLKVVYAALSMGGRPTREMREATEILFPERPKEHFFLSVALRQWFLLLQRTLGEDLSWLLQDYEGRRQALLTQVRGQEALRKALEKKPIPASLTFRVLYRYRVVQKDRSAECDALIISTTGIFPVEARYFGGEEVFSADAAAAPGLLRVVFLWDYFSPALERLVPGIGSGIIQPILSVAGKAPFRHNSPCAVMRPEEIRDFIGRQREVFTEKQVDELAKVFQSQGAGPSTYALPDYDYVMEVLSKGLVKDFNRVCKAAEGLPQRTYNKK